MQLPFYQVDAFTDRLFAGNPAAIVLAPSPLDAALMQQIAAENNLSETAFISPWSESTAIQAAMDIRWFTPTLEVELCGHATLAAAHVIFAQSASSLKEIHFNSRSGPLHVQRKGSRLSLNFPADSITAEPCSAALNSALGMPPYQLYRGRDDLLAVYANADDILRLTPEMDLVANIKCRGIITTASGTEPYDFVSRFFAPRSGINEDPVTGSAHTTLTAFWSERLGKQQLHAKQLSSRGGELFCRNLGERVEISGDAVTYAQGVIHV